MEEEPGLQPGLNQATADPVQEDFDIYGDLNHSAPSPALIFESRQDNRAAGFKQQHTAPPAHAEKTAGIDRGAEDLSKLILERTTLQKRVASLETENQQLISNISQLYKTARQELQWKENELRQLRGQIDWQTKVGSNLNMERRPTAAGGD